MSASSIMGKSVVINLGQGDLNKGFPRVTAQLWAADRPLPEQFIGSLPAAPTVAELYKNWQSIYKNLCERKQLLSRSPEEEDDELEIDEGGITNVSVINFDELCQTLTESINAWLKSPEFINIDQRLRARLDPKEEIRVIVETSNVGLRRLPWQRWNFFEEYPLAELALSRPEYKRQERSQPKLPKQNVRILAILGNCQGIDIEAETKFLLSLQDADVVFLANPSRSQFNTMLWSDRGWDILFFAGHSQTEGETGRIYINENQTNNSLTVEQLEEAVKAAIEKGLKLVIFNSCDGLGLANALEKLHIPTVIVMREPVPNRVAQDFFNYFLQAFALERLPLYRSVQRARRQLQGLEDGFPGASWLPVICQNPAVEPPTWLKLGGIPPCPYRGLFAFREEDAHLFFGREQFASALVNAVKKKPLVAVVGSSGSGKSSVVFAGLIPQLRQDAKVQWQIVSFRPGNNPFESLAAAIAPLWQHSHSLYCSDKVDLKGERLAELELEIALRQDDRAVYKIVERLVQQNFGTRLVLVADQFEELYTLCPESERQTFLDGLLTAVRLAPAFTLVLTLRADFYGYALSYRPFSDALQGAIHNLGPMCREELQSAIAQPAAFMQVELEDGLTNKLIHAVNEQSGRLPLLEFALTQLWSKQQSGWLTHQGYEEIGGVEEALANHAEAVYAQLNEADRQRAQRVFMQLVRLGDETEATRRLATSDEVGFSNWDLVTHLASSRLVVTSGNTCTGEETVEIVHEALIRSWGRLELWVQCDGAFRRWQEQLRSALRQWESSGRDEGALLRGKPLVDADYWQQNRFDELSSGERGFIKQSLALQEREIHKQKRRRQLTISGLTVGLVGVLILAAIAWWQSQNSAMNEIEALSASSEALLTSNQALEALVEAIEAGQQLKKLPRVKAETQSVTVQALQHSLYQIKEYNRLSGHKRPVYAVSISPDGQLIATASQDHTVKLWKRDGTLLKTLDEHSAQVYAVAFSPDSQIIVSGGEEGKVRLWKRDGTLLKTLAGHSAPVKGIAFSPDGQAIATAGWDGKVKLWNKDGSLINTITLKGDFAAQTTVAFSPDGQTIASGGWDGTVKLWKKDGTLIETLPVDRYTSEVYSVAFSLDGQTIATASDDRTVKLWKPDGTLLKTLVGHSAAVKGVAFSPDGRTIASVSDDRTLKLWKPNGTLLTTLAGHSAEVHGVAFSPDGETIASGSEDGTVKLWKPDGTPFKTLSGYSSSVYAVSISPDGQAIATADGDKTVKLWKPDSTLLKTLTGHRDRVFAVAFSPDSQVIVSGGGEGIVKLWKPDGTFIKDLKGDNDEAIRAVSISPDSETIASAGDDTTVKLWMRDGTLLRILRGHTSRVWDVSFSPDNQTIASSSMDGTVKLWNKDGTLYKTLTGHKGEVYGVTFSPDSLTIASASEDGTVKLWKRDGTLYKTLSGHNGTVYKVAFSPNGQIIATTSWDGTIRLWKSDGTFLKDLNGHKDEVWSISFSRDSKTLASASKDKTVILWNWQENLTLDRLLAYSCGWVDDYLRTNSIVIQNDRHRRLCTGIKSQATETSIAVLNDP
jgi:WD40 repeat protein